MADPSTHINYTFEDIQRYLQDKMPAAEMHAIEKAALQDPFLADAIEGFREADAAKAARHLNEINAGLFAEKSRSKIVSFNNRTRWLNVAAIIIIVSGIAIFAAYIFNSSNKQQEIAQVKKKSLILQNPADSTVTNMGASSGVTDSAPVIIAQKKTRQSPVPKAKKETANALISKDGNIEAEDISLTAKNYSPAQVQQNKPASGSIAPTPLLNATNDSVREYLQGRVAGLHIATGTFSGKVVDENNKPIPYATIESADKKTAVITDVNGDFAIQKNDTMLNVIASTVGYYRKFAQLKPGNNSRIVLKETGTDLNEAVVIGYSTKRKKSGAADSKISVAKKGVPDSAMPVGGWQNFNNYVLTELNKDTSNQNFIPSDELVEIEFLIDNAGNPYNFKILKPLDDQHNAKAIDILINGPIWTNTSKNKKAKVTIKF